MTAIAFELRTRRAQIFEPLHENSCRASSCFKWILNYRWIAIFSRLKVFTVKDKLSRMLKHLIRDSDHTHGRILTPFFQICSDGVNRVAYEYGFNEAKLVISIAERVNAVVR